LATEAPAPEIFFGFWYRAILGTRVRRRKLVKVVVLGAALVVGRDRRGQAFALRDACPHRGMPLSHGRLDGERIQCAFHGWKFDVHTGQCSLIPACPAPQHLKLDVIRAGHVPCEERDGFIWVYMAEPEPAGRFAREGEPSPPPAPPPALPLYSERYRFFDLSSEMRTSADHVLTLLLDPAHGPFVHRRWWVLARILFGAFADESQALYEPIPLGFRESLAPRVPDRWSQRLAGSETMTVDAEFVLPSLRKAKIRFGRFWITSLVTVTPVTENVCRFDQRVAWGGLYWLPLAAPLLKFFFWLFLVQDRRAMAWQAEGLGRIPRLMFVDDSDRPAKWYYELKRALAEVRRSGAAFVHPIPGPVTLRWRNAGADDA
jgi:phenylpropionate dioxygenase-like ring-hydroxylating dioxygenase large terminal subunit